MFALLWTAAAAVVAQPADLTGTITDALNDPLAQVTIAVQGPATQIARTDVAGRFHFSGLPPGDYDVAATLEGFAAAQRAVRLTAGGSVSLSLTLTLLVHAEAVTVSKGGDRDVQTTPLAVSVLDGADLQRAEAHNLGDIAHAAPSVAFSQNSDFAQLTIRGIGSNVVFAGSDPSSALYVDGVYMSRPVLAVADFLDLDRVEVVRGPQGTLYGRNAVGGAVNLITRAPTNVLDASARLVAGNLDALRAEGRLSGPIVRGRLLGSAAFVRGVRAG